MMGHHNIWAGADAARAKLQLLDDERAAVANGAPAPEEVTPPEPPLPPEFLVEERPGRPDARSLRDLIRLETFEAFAARQRPPTHLIDRLIVDGFLYSLTGPTGHCKTAIATLMQICILTGRPFAGREVRRGNVLVLVGENSADWHLRMLATIRAMHVAEAELAGLRVVDAAFMLRDGVPIIKEQAAAEGDFAAVFIDTSAAYFRGQDENANSEMLIHASEMRALCSLPGRPAVIALCHPVKSASKDNLIPRGGGSFVAEMDGNLTVWLEDRMVTLHWAGKYRGPPFDPMAFEVNQYPVGLTDDKGREVVSVAAMPIGDDRAEVLQIAGLSEQNQLLRAMSKQRSASVADLARAVGWVGKNSTPLKSKTDRRLHDLEANGLVKQNRAGVWMLTPKGDKAVQELST